MDQPQPKRLTFFQEIAPGILVAATGVGAGDLINASLAGSDLGLTILWAAWMGAILKWLLNEGIARWQLATGTTLMEGWKDKLGRGVCWAFLVYLLLWTVFVGATIIKACGVAGHAITGRVAHEEEAELPTGEGREDVGSDEGLKSATEAPVSHPSKKERGRTDKAGQTEQKDQIAKGEREIPVPVHAVLQFEAPIPDCVEGEERTTDLVGQIAVSTGAQLVAG